MCPSPCSRTLAVAVACLLLGAAPLRAQGPGGDEAWRWVRFGVESGLPSPRIDHVVEAADGIVWASTAEGLAWYDGYAWTGIGAPRGLPAAAASYVAPDAGRGLLVVIRGHLYRGDTSGFRAVAAKRGGVTLGVGEAAALPDGALFIRAAGTLFRLTADRLAEDSIVARWGPDAVSALRRTSRGGIWVAGSAGLFRWNGRRWTREAELHDRARTTGAGELTCTPPFAS